MEIAGKVFIVTGGASGLGEGTARMLAGHGAKVVVADLQVERGQAVAAEIGGAFVRCDVSQEADGQQAVAAALALGKLVGLVNCAGITKRTPTIDVSDQEWASIIDTTLGSSASPVAVYGPSSASKVTWPNRSPGDSTRVVSC